MEISQRTLVFLRKRETKEVLLGLKKTGFGSGKMLGAGGKVEPGEAQNPKVYFLLLAPPILGREGYR